AISSSISFLTSTDTAANLLGNERRLYFILSARGRRRFAVVAGVPPANGQNCSRHPPSPTLWRDKTAWLRITDYFGASELTIFSKRGSPRSGSYQGSSFNRP